jgi:hypothetical protein
VSTLVLLVLVVFAVLSLLLAAWTMFFQGYIYSEPVEAIYWRAPAAGAALTLYLCIWIALDYRSVETPNDEGRYRPLHELSARETEKYDKLTILTQDRKQEQYTRRGENQYVNKSGRRMPERPLEVIATDKEGQEHVFKPKIDAKGAFVKDEKERVRYYEEGNPQRYMEEGFWQITIYHYSWLVMGLLVNFGFLAVWFLCFWLLLRFQWSHALGLAFVAWLISLFVLPMILTQAEKVRKENLPPPATAALIKDRNEAA